MVCALLIAVASLAVDHGLQGALASVATAFGLSSCSSWAPEHRLNSCGARASLLCGTWGPPVAGIKPVSPILAKVASSPLSPQGSPLLGNFNHKFNCVHTPKQYVFINLLKVSKLLVLVPKFYHLSFSYLNFAFWYFPQKQFIWTVFPKHLHIRNCFAIVFILEIILIENKIMGSEHCFLG